MRTLPWIIGGMLMAAAPSWAGEADAEKAARKLPQWKAKCGGGRAVLLGPVVEPLLEDMAKTRIPYSQAVSLQLADCSGNFLRASSSVAAVCPRLADDLPIKAGVPAWNGRSVDADLLRPAEWVGPHDLVRTTRHTAQWYVRRDLFVPIFADRDGSKEEPSRDLKKHRDWFRPGTVVWFGSTSLAKKDCESRKTCVDEQIANIHHMGVVASVEYDDNGDPVNYRLYHGRNERHNNGITDKHQWDKSPPFGNGSQYVLGISPIVKAKRRK